MQSTTRSDPLRRDGTEKPAGCALREFGRQVGARAFAFVRAGASGAAFVHNGDTDRSLLWTVEEVR